MSPGIRRISTLFMGAIMVGLMLPASVAVAADLIPTSLDLEAPTIAELGEPLTLTATVSPDPGGGWITFSRRVTIRVAGTSGRPRIDLDALVTAN